MEISQATPIQPSSSVKPPTLIQRIVKSKSIITRIWIAGYLLGVNALILCYFIPAAHPFWITFGDKAGNLAVILLCLSLTPGIIRRLDLRGPFSQVQLILMVFRRHLGISMYLSALAHVLLVKTFPQINFGLPFALSPFEIAGAIAILLTTPLFLTSNDLAVARLGTLWKKIHMVVYVVAILVLVHLILLGGFRPSTLLSAIIVFAEGLSWASRWYRSKQMRLAIVMILLILCSSTAYATYTYQELTKTPTIDFAKESLMIRIPRDANGRALVSTYTADIVTSHNSARDCWMIIDGKIYDLTEYINVHPGGVETLRSSCGSDGTQAFATKGGRGNPHSDKATALLANYLIAAIGDALPASVTKTIDPARLPPSATLTPKPIIETTQTLSVDIVGAHQTQRDCWLIINGNVYDVTQYIPYHPGGVSQITNYCGKEATNAFNTKETNSAHSANAINILASLRIGSLNQKNVTVQLSVPTYTPPPPASPTILPTPVPTSGSSISTQTLTTSVVATHNTRENCWLIINNNVYDVTQYIPYHPGGVSQITNYCGKEATNAFNTKGGGGSAHSSNANTTLANYKIAALGSTTSTTPTPVPTSGSSATPTPTPQTVSLTSAVVATHNTRENCWLIINNNVYDVTQYIPYHPGGVSQITNYCGKEASTAFNTRGGGSKHSTSANNQLAGYKIGALNGTATITPTPVPAAGSTPTPTPKARKYDDDDDD